MTNTVSDELTSIILQARKLAIDMKHGFIDNDHLLLALLKENCQASKYLQTIELSPLQERISRLYNPNSHLTLRDNLPLTLTAELTLKHGYAIAATYDELTINSIYLLLAMLSLNHTIVKTTLDEAGILIEDVTEDHFKKSVKKFQSPIKAIRTKAYNKIEKFLIEMTANKDGKIKALYKNALNLYRYYEFEEAIKVCNAGLSLSPGNFDFKHLLAYSKYQLRDYKAALNLIEELMKSPSRQHDVNYKIMMAYMYDMTGSFQDSAKILDELLIQNPDDETILNNKGFNLSLQEKYTESIPYFEKVLSIDPTMAFALNNLGFSKFKLGETDKAILLIDKSLIRHKGNSYAYKNKGIVLQETGNKEEALKYFNLALKYGYTEKYGDEVIQLINTIN